MIIRSLIAIIILFGFHEYHTAKFGELSGACCHSASNLLIIIVVFLLLIILDLKIELWKKKKG